MWREKTALGAFLGRNQEIFCPAAAMPALWFKLIL
ncbi:hypothetical protein CLOLEP_00952 [[Clostridium] leptum DSM 753]|uniref:Uncharacterized protein n=1 Tax=[Clostridium] leptum DSM 753 TaxID=428125 RepID=A7VQX0_9FIRM|nr:hypothetical protein CLOLEP_00952 [[Clostridium] leptum DSM 753]